MNEPTQYTSVKIVRKADSKEIKLPTPISIRLNPSTPPVQTESAKTIEEPVLRLPWPGVGS